MYVLHVKILIELTKVNENTLVCSSSLSLPLTDFNVADHSKIVILIIGIVCLIVVVIIAIDIAVSFFMKKHVWAGSEEDQK